MGGRERGQDEERDVGERGRGGRSEEGESAREACGGDEREKWLGGEAVCGCEWASARGAEDTGGRLPGGAHAAGLPPHERHAHELSAHVSWGARPRGADDARRPRRRSADDARCPRRARRGAADARGPCTGHTDGPRHGGVGAADARGPLTGDADGPRHGGGPHARHAHGAGHPGADAHAAAERRAELGPPDPRAALPAAAGPRRRRAAESEVPRSCHARAVRIPPERDPQGRMRSMRVCPGVCAVRACAPPGSRGGTLCVVGSSAAQAWAQVCSFRAFVTAFIVFRLPTLEAKGVPAGQRSRHGRAVDGQ